MITKEESEWNIKTKIEGIKLNDENLDYHINCLIREVETKERVEITEEIISDWFDKLEQPDGLCYTKDGKLRLHALEIGGDDLQGLNNKILRKENAKPQN